MNAVESPLLRLPRELRDEIWSQVLGGNTIHIDVWPKSRLWHCICSDATPGEKYNNLLQINQSRAAYFSIHERHDKCWENQGIERMESSIRSTKSIYKVSRHRENSHLLDLLLTCCQVYEEGHLFLYDRNIFCFNDISELLSSMNPQAFFQRIPYKHLTVLIADLDNSLNRVPISVIHSLKDLKTLHLSLRCYNQDITRLVRASEIGRDVLMSLILRWSILDLKTVSVLFVSCRLNNDSNKDQDRRVRCESLLANHARSKLLDPNGVSQHSERSRMISLVFKHLPEEKLLEASTDYRSWQRLRKVSNFEQGVLWSLESEVLESTLQKMVSMEESRQDVQQSATQYDWSCEGLGDFEALCSADQ